eukprot:scaffold12664_cov107-Isochrysis_galbana.AAC.1
MHHFYSMYLGGILVCGPPLPFVLYYAALGRHMHGRERAAVTSLLYPQENPDDATALARIFSPLSPPPGLREAGRHRGAAGGIGRATPRGGAPVASSGGGGYRSGGGYYGAGAVGYGRPVVSGSGGGGSPGRVRGGKRGGEGGGDQVAGRASARFTGWRRASFPVAAEGPASQQDTATAWRWPSEAQEGKGTGSESSRRGSTGATMVRMASALSTVEDSAADDGAATAA